ncbi:hypothetical protein CH339_11725 [Rhodobium orientis]|uniref:Uncharacterized protein n=1 Tax=Rhodobium orientis TaxID=34017 RepID=A0A327JL41_9HYPH|nr:hypothetical protein [Rhodobium orientis]RAI27007.1 hypothetical protein CH339_11725 [Rhodobium orientis]
MRQIGMVAPGIEIDRGHRPGMGSKMCAFPVVEDTEQPANRLLQLPRLVGDDRLLRVVSVVIDPLFGLLQCEEVDVFESTAPFQSADGIVGRARRQAIEKTIP